MSVFSPYVPFLVCAAGFLAVLAVVSIYTAVRLQKRCKTLEAQVCTLDAPDVNSGSVPESSTRAVDQTLILAQLKKAINDLSVPASLCDLNGTYLRINPVLADILGFAPNVAKGRCLGELASEADLMARLGDAHAEALSGCIPVFVEHGNGIGQSRTQYSTAIIPLCDHTGTPYVTLVLSQQVANIATARCATGKESSLAGLALEMARVGYWRMTADGSGKVFLSKELRRMMSLQETPDGMYDFMEDIYPRIVRVNPQPAEQLRGFLMTPKTGSEDVFQCDHWVDRGSEEKTDEIFTRFTARTTAPGLTTPPVIYGVLQDITETKRFEMALRRESERLKAMFSSSPIGLAILVNDKVDSMNPCLSDMLGLQVGDNPYSLFYEPSVTPEYIRKRLDDNNGRVTNAAVRARSRDGREYSLLASYYRMSDHEQEAVIGWVVDVTELRKNEEELIAARDQAEMAVQVKSRFLANISHEIRTPMNAIIGLSYLLLQSTLSIKQREDLEKIGKASRTLLQLINDILDVSKLETGKLNIDSSEFVINDVLLKLVNTLVTESERKGITLVFRISPSVPGIVKGDSLRLEQVLLNLIGNAIKFSSEGEVVVSANLIEHSQKGVVVRFAVADHGIGIAEANLPLLFQSFTQGDTSSTRRFGGAGIGLTISKSLIEAMGGHIEVESTLGRGSTFSFTVPFSIEGIRHRDAGAPSNLRGARVLVVDDSPIERGVLGEELQRMHFRADQVENGVQAIEAAAKACREGRPYTFALIDWQMPVMDGLETARTILNDTRVSPKPHLLMITAHIGSNIFARSEHAGLSRVLLKPVNPSTLLDSLIELAADTAHAAEDSPIRTDSGVPHGLRVLVAEDSPINQQVIEELLKAVGVTVTLANNGREALERLNETDYDLVFMDIQMPEMDGLVAAQSIRAMPRFQKMPIIAMTAHAMPEDRETSLAAGMDEHITKPVDPQELYRVIRRWTQSGALNIQPSPPDLTSSSPAPGIPGIPGIDACTALARIGGNIELYFTLLKQFHLRYAGMVDELDGLMHSGSTEAVRALLHTFTGIASSLGAMNLATYAGALEAVLATNSPATAIPQYEVMCAELRLVMDGLDLLDEEVCSHDIPAPDHAELRKVLSEAIAFINMQSPQAIECFAPVREHIVARFPNEFDDLLFALDNFDFPSASTALQVLSKKMEIPL